MVTATLLCARSWLSLAVISECAVHFIILLQRLGMRHVKPVRAIAERGGHLPICDLQSPGSNVAALKHFSRNNEFVTACCSFFQPRCKHEIQKEVAASRAGEDPDRWPLPRFSG